MNRMQSGLLAFVLSLGLCAQALAADNSVLDVHGGGFETFANKDIAGVKFPKSIPFDSAGGDMTDTANHNLWIDARIGGNIMAALTGAMPGCGTTPCTNRVGVFNIDQGTPGTTNGVSIANIGSSAVLSGNGVTGTGSPRVTVASDNTPFGVLAQSQAIASGGWTPKWFIAANSDNATSLKGSAGIVHAVQVFGIASAPAYLKFYDKATSPTCGSDTIVKQIMIPAASTAANGAGAVAIQLDAQFSTGIAYCVVTGITATDDTSPTASQLVINIDWK